MKKTYLILTFFSSLVAGQLLAEENYPKDKASEMKGITNESDRSFVCNALANPFSHENMNVINNEIENSYPDKDSIFYKITSKVNQKTAEDSKKRCKDKKEVNLFDYESCATSCESEFALFIGSHYRNKDKTVNTCIKMCQATQVTYRSLTAALLYKESKSVQESNPENCKNISSSKRDIFKVFEEVGDSLKKTDSGSAVSK